MRGGGLVAASRMLSYSPDLAQASRSYQVPRGGQAPLPAVVHDRVNSPSALRLILNTLPVAFSVDETSYSFVPTLTTAGVACDTSLSVGSTASRRARLMPVYSPFWSVAAVSMAVSAVRACTLACASWAFVL